MQVAGPKAKPHILATAHGAALAVAAHKYALAVARVDGNVERAGCIVPCKSNLYGC